MRLGLGLGNDLHGQSRGGVFGGLDPATQELLDQATTDGYTAASGDTLTALDEYIKGLKEDGIWSKLDLLYVFATNGDSDFATYNIKDPANFQATKVNAPTFTSLEGFTGDAVSAYLDTGFSPSTDGINYTQNSASYGIYKRTNVANSTYVDMGILTGSSSAFERTNRTSAFDLSINQSSQSALSSGATAAGLHHINRQDSSNLTLFVNGSTFEDLSGSSSTPPAVKFYILALGLISTASNYSARQLSIAFAGADLSAEASDFYTHTQNYMTALGKEV